MGYENSCVAAKPDIGKMCYEHKWYHALAIQLVKALGSVVSLVIW